MGLVVAGPVVYQLMLYGLNQFPMFNHDWMERCLVRTITSCLFWSAEEKWPRCAYVVIRKGKSLSVWASAQ